MACASPCLFVARVRAEDPPSPPSEMHMRPGNFHLDAADAYLGAEFEAQSRRVRYFVPGEKHWAHENRDMDIRECVGLNLAGDVVDPNLVAWRGNLELGASHDWYREEHGPFHDEDRDTGFLSEYDLSGDILRNKPVSFNVYARRGDDRISRRFLPSLHEDRQEYGASMLALLGPLTTELGFETSDLDRTGNRYREDNEDLDMSRFYIDNKLDLGEHQRLRLSYDHERQESNWQGSDYSFDTRRDEFRLEHGLDFGPQYRYHLDTIVRYNEEQGDLARDEFELTPRLTLNHNDKFQTVYRYSLYRFEQDALEVASHKFDFETLYRPNERWRISSDVYAVYEDADNDVQTHEYGGGFDIAYDRPTPWGKLLANASLSYDRTQYEGSAGWRIVRNEGHAVSTVKVSYLNHRDVARFAILAHDAKRLRFYVEGHDYLLLWVGRRIYIRRIPTGRIADGEVVYFDYKYRVQTNASLNTYHSGFSIEHEFPNGITPYYNLEARCQDNEWSRGTPIYDDSMSRHRMGVRYDRPSWSTGLEYEIFDDQIEPYDAVHLTGHWTIVQSALHSLDASGEISHYWFEGGWDRRRVWWAEGDLKDRIEINQYLSATGGAALHWEDDSVDGHTHGVDLETGLHYVRGLLTVELTAEYDLLTFERSRENGVEVWVRVRRDLGSLLPKREESR